MLVAPKRFWPVIALTFVYLAIRLPNLAALPIFGDEAIYLRWAQLIRAGYPWISLADPKPPLHFWLIALVFNWTSDPLLSARLISLLAGAVCIPLVFLIALEAQHFRHSDIPKSDGPGLVATILFILCPFLAFYQRLATQDALFTCESMLIVWLSLRWSRTYTWPIALALGLALAAALNTRQGVSYTISLFPVILWPWRLPAKTQSKTSALQLLSAALLAALLWSPFLLANTTSAPLVPEIKRRIFYQDSFSATPEPRWQVAARNADLTFIPHWHGPDPSSGWLYFYLTPTVYLLSIAGFIYLACRHRRLFFMLLMWESLLLLPLLILASTIFSRYILAAVPPLLLAAAFFITDLTSIIRLMLPQKKSFGIVLSILLWTPFILWPLKDLHTQIFDWPHQTLTARDQYQYLTGWTSGYATRDAIRYLQNLPRAGPIVIITTNAWGNPPDAFWAYLSNQPNIQLYYTDADQIFRPAAEPNTYLLKPDKWLYPPEIPVQFPADAKLFFVTNDPVHTNTADIPAANFFQPKNPNFAPPKTFYGIEGPTGEAVSVFPILMNPGVNP